MMNLVLVGVGGAAGAMARYLSGVGYGRNPRIFMKAGDVVEVEVEGVGILRNPIQA